MILVIFHAIIHDTLLPGAASKGRITFLLTLFHILLRAFFALMSDQRSVKSGESFTLFWTAEFVIVFYSFLDITSNPFVLYSRSKAVGRRLFGAPVSHAACGISSLTMVDWTHMWVDFSHDRHALTISRNSKRLTWSRCCFEKLFSFYRSCEIWHMSLQFVIT